LSLDEVLRTLENSVFPNLGDAVDRKAYS
jgi:hypothetical protein